MFVKELFEQTYKADVTVMLSTLDELNRWMRKRDPDVEFDGFGISSGKVISHDWSSGFNADHGVREWIVWFPTWPRKPSEWDLAGLAHETSHLAMQILRHRRLYLSEDTEEAYAYYIDSLFRVLSKVLKDAADDGRKNRRAKSHVRRTRMHRVSRKIPAKRRVRKSAR